MSAQKRVRDLIVRYLEVAPEADAHLVDDLGADSLDNIELVMALEEEFGIEIPDDAAETFKTFGDVVRFIEQALA